MAKTKKFDFSGWATRVDIKCKDGRVIRRDAFKDNHNTSVPLVWQHLHSEPENILGHAMLENREEGVYAYCTLNSTSSGQQAKALVEHGDITFLSIYANDLVQKNKDVLHGNIREVSLVLAGANPGALIDNISVAHSDGDTDILEDEAVIYTDSEIEIPEKETAKEDAVLAHAEGEETIGDIFESFTEDQKNVVYAIVAQLIEDGSISQSAIDENEEDEDGGEEVMKHNVFETQETGGRRPRVKLTDEQWNEIRHDAMRLGSLKAAVIQHAGTYGIDNIDYLFPDAQAVTNQPTFIARDMAWVRGVISGARHTPFSRIKSLHADITVETARALGYVTGNLKKEEVFGLLRRITTPTTIYKKQKLDRDDIVDITDFNVVAWLKSEMRVMLDEEIARAVLLGDGRDPVADADDKIDETCIRPIWTDADMYAHHILVLQADGVDDIMDKMILARENYKGSGNPTFYTTTSFLTSMLLLKDTVGRRLYPTQRELESTLRVKEIVEVPVMSALSRTITGAPDFDVDLIGIFVNMSDYTMGADKGGEISFFDDFDIDYNQYKYLLEGRMSGALVVPKSAIVVEQYQVDPV